MVGPQHERQCTNAGASGEGLVQALAGHVGNMVFAPHDLVTPIGPS